MGNKYELTKATKIAKGGDEIVYRIRALRDIFDGAGKIIVRKGELGGWVESYDNLSQEGSCWVFGNASEVLGTAKVEENAIVRNSVVYDGATIGGNSLIEDSCVYQGATVQGNAKVVRSIVYGRVVIKEQARLYDSRAYTRGNGSVHIGAAANIYDGCDISGADVYIVGAPRLFNARIEGRVQVWSHALIKDASVINNSPDKDCTRSLIEGIIIGASVIGQSQIPAWSIVALGAEVRDVLDPFSGVVHCGRRNLKSVLLRLSNHMWFSEKLRRYIHQWVFDLTDDHFPRFGEQD